jgi:hypothetical protein
VSSGPEPRAAGPVGGQDRLAAVFRAQAAGPGQTSGGLLAEAVAGGLQAAEGMVACSLTVMTGEEFGTVTSTSPAALALDLLQYQARSGPCVTAASQHRRYLAAGPGDPYWALPGWAQAADEYRVGAVLSVPLPGDRRRAGLNLYAVGPAGLQAPAVIARAELIARLISTLLTGLAGPLPPLGPAPRQAPPQLPGSVAERRAVLNQARDMLAWQEQITAEEAFARLARRSGTEARSIFDIARDVADGTASDTEATG